MSRSSLDQVFDALAQDLSPADTADGTLWNAAQQRHSSDFRQTWCEVLRKPRRRFLRRVATEPLIALWALDETELSGRERELACVIRELCTGDTATATSGLPSQARQRRQKELPVDASGFNEALAGWLAEASAPLGAWEVIAVGEILLRYAPEILPDQLVRALGLLHAAARDMLPTETTLRGTAGADSPESWSLQRSESFLNCEAAWILGLLLQASGSAFDLLSAAAEELSAAVLRCTDHDGLLHGSMVSRQHTLLVPLTRAAAWASAFQQPLLDPAASHRFREFVGRSTMMLLTDGSFVVPGEDPCAAGMSAGLGSRILRYAAKLAGFRRSSRVRKLVAACEDPGDHARGRRRLLRDLRSRRSPPARSDMDCTSQSDQACVALMRSDADIFADLVLVEWHSSEVHLHLAALGLPFLSGVWACDVVINGESVPLPAIWNCTCWFLDDEAAFIELEAAHDSGTRQIRHVLLSRLETFAILTDSVLGNSDSSEVRLSTSLSLRPGVVVDRDIVTRELILQRDDLRLRAFPIGLPDDRILPAVGQFESDDGQLRMEAAGRGCLTLPLMLDWHPSRAKLPAEWAPLTVAEARRRLPPADAEAFRIRVGGDQWLVFRGHTNGDAARTVLGLHTLDESVYGKVTGTGHVQAIVRVEGLPAADHAEIETTAPEASASSLQQQPVEPSVRSRNTRSRLLYDMTETGDSVPGSE